MIVKKSVIIPLAVICIFLLGILIGLQLVPPKTKIVEIPKSVEKSVPCKEPTGTKKLDTDRFATIKLPAVDENDSGVTAHLDVKVMPGSGRILLNVNNILSRSDTQESARTAALVASEFTGYDISSLDIIYDINANASILQGPSAGAAMTITTIAALQNRTLKSDVMITGTINHDMTIGPAGKVDAKAKASKNAGASKFLVPLGESVKYEDKEYCADYGFFEGYCQTEYVPVRIEKSVGINVVEVENISDVVDNFF